MHNFSVITPNKRMAFAITHITDVETSKEKVSNLLKIIKEASFMDQDDVHNSMSPEALCFFTTLLRSSVPKCTYFFSSLQYTHPLVSIYDL